MACWWDAKKILELEYRGQAAAGPSQPVMAEDGMLCLLCMIILCLVDWEVTGVAKAKVRLAPPHFSCAVQEGSFQTHLDI